MEKKCNDKASREEELEEQCLQLKEALSMMNVQVARIESDLDKKVRDRDKKVKALQARCEMLEREKRMREDIDDMNGDI